MKNQELMKLFYAELDSMTPQSLKMELEKFEELEIMEYVAEESGVLYEHQLDKDCYVFRDENGFLLKVPKAIADHPRLTEYLEKYK